MTIDEAIFHCEKEVEHQQKELSYYQDHFMIEYFDSCEKCISDLKQLVEWLKELKAYKEQTTDGDLITKLKKIRAEMIQERDSVDLSCADSFNWNIRLIDKYIAELKGESEEKYENKNY